MTFGEKLSKLRKENHYTQEQFADLLGVSRQAVSKWESGAAWPETDKLIRISQLLGCSLDYLVMDEDRPGEAPQDSGPAASGRKWFRERKSEKTLWGLPLWHIGKNAHGFIAVGLNARGVIVLGLKARGLVSCGLLSLGLLSFGMLPVGLLSFGLLALGILSFGCFSFGLIAAGAISFGILSLGAVAIGEFSAGALAIGKYAAVGDNARAMIALGNTYAEGSLFRNLGVLSAGNAETVRLLLDAVVPAYLSWAKNLFLALL